MLEYDVESYQPSDRERKMQETANGQHSSYVNLRPNECVAHYLNQDIITRVACVVGGVLVAIGTSAAVAMGALGRMAYLFAVVLVIAIAAIEVVLILRYQYDFQGIVTLDCDPKKMLETEKLLGTRLRFKNRKVQHQLIGAQAAMLTGDSALATRMLGAVPTTMRENAATKLMKKNIAIGCARLEKRWDQVRVLRDEVAAEAKNLRKALKGTADLLVLIADQSLAVADNDLQSAEELLDRYEAAAQFPQQRANAAYRRGELECLKGNFDAARTAYQQAADMGGTCQFAELARAWLEAH